MKESGWKIPAFLALQLCDIVFFRGSYGLINIRVLETREAKIIKLCCFEFEKENTTIFRLIIFALSSNCLLTYFAEGNYSISDNMLNFSDLILVVSVSISILIWGDTSTRFNRFDLGCLVAVICIIAFWGISKNHVITNYSVQSIMVISYSPVLGRMTNQKKNTEAFSVWIMMLVAAGISLFASKGWLASVYAIRALLCTGTLLLLMLRIEIVSWIRENHKG